MWNSPLRNTSPPYSNIIHLKQIKPSREFYKLLQIFLIWVHLGLGNLRVFVKPIIN